MEMSDCNHKGIECKAASRVGLMVSWQIVGWRCMDGKGAMFRLTVMLKKHLTT